METVPLVQATQAHAAALALIHADAFPPERRWGAEALGLQLSLPGAFGWIDGRGGMVLARVAADEAEILTLAVAVRARRAGVGRGLLTGAMREAGLRGAVSMVLEVGVRNAEALGLYRGMGFVEVGRRRGYYPGGEDASVMRVGLHAPAVSPGQGG